MFWIYFVLYLRRLTKRLILIRLYGDIPLGFILILFGFFVAAIVLTAVVIVWKQRRLQRLKDPHKDYYRKKG